MHAEILERDKAVDQIAERITADDSYIVAVPSDQIGIMMKIGEVLDNFTCYADLGSATVLHTDMVEELVFISLALHGRMAMTATVVVPRSTPDRLMIKALGKGTTLDKTHFLIHGSSPLVATPKLYVDALEKGAPEMARAIYLHEVRPEDN